jgi:hypothetical protein
MAVGPRPERPLKEILMPFYETIIKPGLPAGHRSIIHMEQLMIA